MKLFIFLITTANYAFAEYNADTLELVHIIFRHGDRIPDPRTAYPTDPYLNHSYFPYNLGDLTENGMRRMYKIGQSYRDRYKQFLGDFYFPDLVQSLTDDYERCQLSVQCVHAGLFPPKFPGIIPGLHWQPIPYQLDNQYFGSLSHNPITIPNPTDEETIELLNYIQKFSGFPFMNPILLFRIQDRINNERNNGLKIPKWAQPIWPEPMVSKSYHYFYQVIRQNLPAAVGTLMKKITIDSKLKSEALLQPEKRKLILYGGHDTNIAAILAALNVQEDEVVNWGAYIIFELHRINNIYGFKIYLNNFDGLQLLEIQNCGTFCPLDQFIRLTAWLYS